MTARTARSPPPCKAGAGLNTSTGGILTLANSNTYGGATTISSGIVNIAHPLAVQNSTVNVASSGALSFAAGIVNATLGGLEGPGNVALTTTASEPVTLNVGQNGQSTTYAAA